jgi:hypothetical protein
VGEVTIARRLAALQAARKFISPEVKLIIAGTRPADIKARIATTVPLAFGIITPTASPAAASGISLRPRMAAPSSRR